MIENKHGNFGREIQLETSRLLRQGRRMKKLSLAQAAKELEMSPFLLKSLEDGTTSQALRLVRRALKFYGFDELNFMDMCQELMLGKTLREMTSKKREHLSVPGEDPKPWEKPPDSLSAARKQKLDRPKCEPL